MTTWIAACRNTVGPAKFLIPQGTFLVGPNGSPLKILLVSSSPAPVSLTAKASLFGPTTIARKTTYAKFFQS
uniref:Uncharacterized protein n=1 Tax=Cucumis sativus TaxID=3659 RepID=A0A0A0L402_CUCSA